MASQDVCEIVPSAHFDYDLLIKTYFAKCGEGSIDGNCDNSSDFESVQDVDVTMTQLLFPCCFI